MKKKEATSDKLNIDQAKELLAKHEQDQMKEFVKELEALSIKYGVVLTARFKLFNQLIDPPITVIPKPKP